MVEQKHLKKIKKIRGKINKDEITNNKSTGPKPKSNKKKQITEFHLLIQQLNSLSSNVNIQKEILDESDVRYSKLCNTKVKQVDFRKRLIGTLKENQ